MLQPVDETVDDDRPRPPGTDGLGRLRRAPAAAVVAGLVAVSILLRLRGLGTWYWIDEGISLGIASHPLAEIPGLLVSDGSPPLYYLLLHGWMAVFGSSEVSTHSLSLLFAVATVPAAWWAGRSLFDRRVGLIAAGLFAFNPFLTGFSRETRMYTLVALLSVLVTASFLHVYAFGRRRYLPLFVGSLALLLYTHTWGLFAAAGCAAALLPCLLARSDRRRLAVDAGIGFGLAALLFAPWLPTLLYQAAHNGAPWSPRPVPREALSAVGEVLGDLHERVLVALVVAGGGVLLALARRGRSPEGAATRAMGVLIAATVGLGWVSAQVSPAWAPRYFSIFVAPILLLASLALARSGSRGILALVLILGIWTQPLSLLSGGWEPIGRDAKAVDRPVAAAVSPLLGPDDLVVVMQMEEVPLLHHYLPGGLRYADPAGPVADPGVADWRDALERMEASNAPADLAPLVDAVPAGHKVLLVCQITADRPVRRWFAIMEERCREWKAWLAADDRLRPVAVPALGRVRDNLPESVLLFEKSAG